MTLSAATLRTDALGIAIALALTTGAGAIIVGPKLFAPVPSHQLQAEELEARKREAADLEKETGSASQTLDTLTAESAGAVQLLPADRVNDRLAALSLLAETEAVALSQATALSPAPLDADAKSQIIPLRLVGTSPYPAVSQFIHSLRDRFRDTAVTGIHLAAAPGGHTPENNQAAFTIDLAWHTVLAGSAAQPPKSE